MPECPSDADLSKFLNESLPPDRAGMLSAHVDSCSHCQVRLDKLTEGSDGAAARYKDLSSLISSERRWGLNRGSDGTARIEPAPDAATQIIGGATSPPPPLRFTGLPAVPGFDVVAEIGRGGMGVVYKARHRRLNRLVALKMILAGGAADTKTVQRFLFEAEVLARIQHPQVVQVYEIDTFPGPNGVATPYLAMELLESGTLSHRLKDGPLPPRAAAEMMEGLARAVHAAHLQGVVHRDLKPGNILFGAAESGPQGGEGQPGSHATASSDSVLIAKVSDFGLAKFVQNVDVNLTHSGQIVGTPTYMAPEQAAGVRTLGPEADVYSLGAILYECLTGRRPFEGGDPLSVLLRVINDPPTNVRSLRPDIPRDLAAVTMKCLEKDPKRRYPSAGDLANDLKRFQTNRPTVARPATGRERAWLWMKRNPAEVVLLAALVLVMAAGFVGVAGQWARAEQKAADEHRALEQAERARADAQEAHAAAVAALAESRKQREIAELREARLAFTQAAGWCEIGQVDRGLHGFVRALQLAEENHSAELARAIRVNLAAWPAVLPPTRRAFPHSASGAAGQPRQAVFTPDGKRMVSVGRESTAYLWDVQTGRPLLTYEASLFLKRLVFPVFTFWSVAISPDGKTVVAGGSDGQLWVWDVGNPVARAALPAAIEGDGNVWAVEFTPDGKVWAVDGRSGVQLWDLRTQKSVARLAVPGATRDVVVHCIAVSPDGARVYTGGRDGVFREWDVAARQVIASRSLGAWLQDIAISPDGREVATTGLNGVCRVFQRPLPAVDADTVPAIDSVARSIGAGGSSGQGVAYSPGGRYLLVSDSDGLVRLIDRVAEVVVGPPVQFPASALRPRFRPRSDEYVVPAGDTLSVLRAIEPPGFVLNAGVEGRSECRGVAFDAAGGRIATATGRRLAVYDARTGAQQHAAEPLGSVLWFRPDPVRPRLVYGIRNTIGAYDWASGARPLGDTMRTGNLVRGEITPDGSRTLTYNSEGLIHQWDNESLRILRSHRPTLTPHGGTDTRAMALRADGRELLVSHGSEVGALDPSTLNPIRPSWNAPSDVVAVQYTPDGTRAFVGMRNNSARLFDAATGRPVSPPFLHDRVVGAVAVSPDGTTLLTGSQDTTARFWDAATGLPLGPALRHPGPVGAVAYSPTGDRVATGANGLFMTWKTPPPPLTESLEDLRKKVQACVGEVSHGNGGE